MPAGDPYREAGAGGGEPTAALRDPARLRVWNQEGISACLRCPQVVTNDVLPNERVVATADPRNIADAT